MTLTTEISTRVPAIRTRYNGVSYRSRLEARWACLFDSLKWPHVYEPVDLDWYVPDFVLTFPHGPIAVEVKPEFTMAALREHVRRIHKSGWTSEAMAVGACLFADCNIGQHTEPVEADDFGEQFAEGPANVFTCLDCGCISLRNDDHGYRCRVNGCYDGASHVGGFDPAVLEQLWKDAGDRVQWKPGA